MAGEILKWRDVEISTGKKETCSENLFCRRNQRSGAVDCFPARHLVHGSAPQLG